MKIILSIDCINDSFAERPGEEVNSILRNAATRFGLWDNTPESLNDTKLRDTNGNKCGVIRVLNDSDDERDRIRRSFETFDLDVEVNGHEEAITDLLANLMLYVDSPEEFEELTRQARMHYWAERKEKK